MPKDVRGELVSYSKLTEPTRATIEHLVRVSGVATPPAQLYLARRLSWHLGAIRSAVPPSGIAGDTVAFVDRRAAELIDANRRRLPPVIESTMPGGR
jgi:hypothetical protein